MSKINKEKLFPFVWGGWDMQDTLIHSYYDVEFTGDWGVFKNGEKYKSINIDYANGIVEAFDENGSEIVKTQSYSVIPK